MHNIWNNKTRLYINIFILSFVTASVSYALMNQKDLGITLLLFSMIVLLIGLFKGVVLATILAIIFYFVVGSIFFWLFITQGNLSLLFLQSDDVMLRLLIWMVGQLIIAITAGRINRLLNETFQETTLLKEEIDTLVAVDRITGFDNKSRMLVELELEFNRAKRYDESFSFLLMKWNYYDEFRKLYGSAETKGALQNMAKVIYQYTRTSDQRFRVADDLFGFILPQTPVEHIDVVIEKIKKEVSVYRLSNQKLVTLSFDFGFVGFDDSYDTSLELYENTLEQVDRHV